VRQGHPEGRRADAAGAVFCDCVAMGERRVGFG